MLYVGRIGGHVFCNSVSLIIIIIDRTSLVLLKFKVFVSARGNIMAMYRGHHIYKQVDLRTYADLTSVLHHMRRLSASAYFPTLRCSPQLISLPNTAHRGSVLTHICRRRRHKQRLDDAVLFCRRRRRWACHSV